MLSLMLKYSDIIIVCLYFRMFTGIIVVLVTAAVPSIVRVSGVRHEGLDPGRGRRVEGRTNKCKTCDYPLELED